MEVYLLEASPYDPGTLALVNLRLSSNGRAVDYGGNTYEPRLSVSLDYTSEVFSGNLTGGSTAANGNILIANPDGELDYLLDYSWDGREVVIKYAPDEDTPYASFTTVFSGSTKDITVGEIDIILILRDNSERLAQVIQPNQYLGTGGAQGAIDNKNKPKPLLYGKCFNFEPILLDGAKLIYQLNDGVLTTIHDVFDRGVALTTGANFATHALLDAEPAINIAGGTYATCLAQGYIRLGALPSGLLTCDASGFPVYTIADIVQNILLDGIRGGLVIGDLNTTSFTDFETTSNWESGFYLKESDAKVGEVIEELVSSVYGYWYYGFDGLLNIKRFAFDTPVDTIEAFQINTIKREESEIPNWSVDVNYKRVWRVHGRDEIAFADNTVEAPIAVYRRYSQKPTTPTGDGIPTDWLANYPGYSNSNTVSGVETFGPVWVSTNTQIGGVSQAAWSEPRIKDSNYRGWYFQTNAISDQITATSNRLKTAASLPGDLPFCVVNKPITGAFRLSWKVGQSGGAWAIGVSPYENDLTNVSLDQGDMKDVFVYQHGTNAMYGGAPFTILRSITDYNSDPSFSSSSIATDDEFEIVCNGQVFEFYQNGQLKRSHIFDPTWDGITHWASFYIPSVDTEIYDIVWEKGTVGNSVNVGLEYSEGSLSIDETQNSLRNYSDGSSDVNSLIHSKIFPGIYTSVELDYITVFSYNYIGLDLDGLYGQIYALGDGTIEVYSPGLVYTGSWASGDTIAIDVDRGREIFYLNGAVVWQRNTTHISYSTSITLDLSGRDTQARNFKFISRNTSSYYLKKSTSTTTFVSPFTNTTPTIAGGYVLLATTTSLLFSQEADNMDRVYLKVGFTYTNSGGSAVTFTPDIVMELSTNNGVSWSAAGTHTYNPAPPTAVAPGANASVTGTSDAINFGASNNLPMMLRVKIKNSTAGVYSVSLTNAYLTLEWRGF